MKKILALLLVGSLLFVPVRAADAAYAVKVPFLFDEQVVDVQGNLVQLDGDKPTVCNLDGTAISTPASDETVLCGGYLCVKLAGTLLWTICHPDGTDACPAHYGYIQGVQNDVAIVCNGAWHPPGYYAGDFGAVNLKTGREIVPLSFSSLSFSADGKYLYTTVTGGLRVFSLDGTEVTDSVGLVAVSSYDNGWFQVENPKTGLLGAADETGKLRVPAKYSRLGDRVLSGALLVYKDGYYGASSIDGSGTLLQPLIYQSAAAYACDVYVLKRWGDLKWEDSNTISCYYGDGGQAIASGTYSTVDCSCGDILWMHRLSDGALCGVSKTGEVVSGPYPDAYLEFGGDDYDGKDFDFVLIGKGVSDGNAGSSVTTVVNRWGDVISPASSLGIIHGGRVGLTLIDTASSSEETYLLSDGTQLAVEQSQGTEIDYQNGWIAYNDGTTAWMTDFEGNVLVPKGLYQKLEIGDIYSMLCYDGPETFKKPGADSVWAQDLSGKYGMLSVESTPYAYTAHTWAKTDLAAAISAGLVPEEQQRDWRDNCTREAFCQLLAPLLDKAGLKAGETSASFSDCSDAAVVRAASLGIVKGVGDGKFAPNRSITRQEAAVMLSRCASLLGIEENSDALSFSDLASAADWARDAIGQVSSITGNGSRVMQGVSNNSFDPLGIYTREQSILTIYRLARAAAAQIG